MMFKADRIKITHITYCDGCADNPYRIGFKYTQDDKTVKQYSVAEDIHDDKLYLYQLIDGKYKRVMSALDCNAIFLEFKDKTMAKRIRDRYAGWKTAISKKGHSRNQSFISVPYSAYDIDDFARYLNECFSEEGVKHRKLESIKSGYDHELYCLHLKAEALKELGYKEKAKEIQDLIDQLEALF